MSSSSPYKPLGHRKNCECAQCKLVREWKRGKEKKTVRDWCVSCVFDKVKGRFRVRESELPKELTCLQCLYEKVSDMKITKPKEWRKKEANP
jgi:hypothetical protein